MAHAAKKCVLWLHPQPEHYHNCMMDDLARASNLEYVAAFSYKGTGLYRETPIPTVARSVFLRTRQERVPGFWNKAHLDWRKDLAAFPYDAVIVAGYLFRTHREVIADAHRRKIPVAMWSDSNIRSQLGGGIKESLKRFAKRQFLRRIIHQTDLLLTANSLGVEYWRYYGAPPQKIVLSPCYADYQRVDLACRTDRSQVLGRIGLLPEHKLLLTAARLVPAKGLDLMIRAFLALGLSEKGYRYAIAGVGPLESQLKELSGTALDRSIFFIGFQQPSDALALMHHAELFVLPSVYEPHGIVVPESMAASTPVLASDAVGAAYDLIDAGVNGEIFRSGDSQDLQSKLLVLANQPERLPQMRLAARKKFETWFQEFSPIKVVDREMHRLLNLPLPGHTLAPSPGGAA